MTFFGYQLGGILVGEDYGGYIDMCSGLLECQVDLVESDTRKTVCNYPALVTYFTRTEYSMLEPQVLDVFWNSHTIPSGFLS